jgi:hypothetical protein
MEVEKEVEPKQDERVAQMAATIGRMQIEALAASAGAVDAKAVAEIVSKNTKAEIDAAGTVKVLMIDPETGDRLRMPNAEAMTPGQFIAQMKASPETGPLFQDGAPGKPKAQPPGGISKEENPWHRDTFNLSQQAMLLRTEPVYAKRLQDAARGTLPDNPWSAEGFNLTAQARILKDDPAAAERFKAEVAPKEKNPWLKGQEHLTAQVLLIRSNPDKARRLKAEALLANGPAVKKSYVFMPPVGAFKRMGTGR